MVIGPVTLTVCCDRCGAQDDLPTVEQTLFPLSAPGFKLWGVTPEALAAARWFSDRAGDTFCPTCANVREGAD
jgi:hypothetical protein